VKNEHKSQRHGKYSGLTNTHTLAVQNRFSRDKEKNEFGGEENGKVQS
jgi:hypothetical protein